MEGERFLVRVRYNGTKSYADLAPVLDEMVSRFGSLDTEVARPKPPFAGGAFPFALQLALDLNNLVGVVSAGAAVYGAAFLAELGKQDAKALRQKLLKIPVLDVSAHSVLSPTPVSLMVGTVQFYINSPMTEQELATALQKAAELVATMPEGRVNNPTGASGWPITWDSNSQSWKDALNP
jgi:hypothetical protein